MQVRIKQLRLKNFKGIRDLTIDLDTCDAEIFGTNESGKTSVYDSFSWLFTDKDSQGRSDFEIKTVDEHGQTISGLDHEVEGALDVDGRELTLKKVYREKWTKKKGSANLEFTGHETKHWVDGVPTPKKTYDGRVAEIATEETIRLLTNTRYFADMLAWTKRRQIVLSACGDVPDEEVVASNKDLAKLGDILSHRSLDDHRKVIAEKKKQINEELKQIPSRIDECNNSLPDTSEIDTDLLKKNIENHKREKAAAEKEKLNLESGGQVAELTKKLREIEAEIQQATNSAYTSISKELRDEQAKLKTVQKKIEDANEAIRKHQTAIREKEAAVQTQEEKVATLRKQWHEENKKEFSAESSCPTCGQDMPEATIEESRQRFNQQKADRLRKVSDEGKAHAAEAVGLKQRVEEEKAAVQKILADLQAPTEEEEKIEARISELNNTHPQAPNELTNQKADLEKQIAAISTGDNAAAIEKLDEKIAYQDAQIEAIQESLSKLGTYEKTKARMQELRNREKELATEYEAIEHEQFLADEFVRQKVNMLEEKINARFNLARFKMFDVQVNGGIQENCVVTYKGVPYPSMNNAARINIGLDIINTLSEHYGLSMPIFVDNAESVVDVADIGAQTIQLIVSAEHKELTIQAKEEVCQSRKAS